MFPNSISKRKKLKLQIIDLEHTIYKVLGKAEQGLTLAVTCLH